MILPLIMAFVLTGCSTFQYSSRSVDVRNRAIGTKDAVAEIVVDYDRSVTATSDYQMTKSEAIKEAEYLCIVNNNIDLVVDPIVKIEFSPFQLKKKYRATITGFAGVYKAAPAGIDAVKEYKMEEVEKYKLLTDPDFPQHYYNKGTGDNFYINSSTGQIAKQGSSSKSSFAFAPKTKTPKVQKQYDFNKSRKLRNAGAGLTIAGAVSTFLIGIPCMTTSYKETYDSYGYTTYDYNEGQDAAGAVFVALGNFAMLSGIPMWCVGAVRMKRSGGEAKVSMGGTSNGVGLRLKF